MKLGLFSSFLVVLLTALAHAQTVICLREHNTHRALPPQVIDWTDVVSTRPVDTITKVSSSSIAILPYSSGTTGSPKGVMLSHKAFGTMMDILKRHFDQEVLPAIGVPDLEWEKEFLLLNLPFYHIFGFGVMCLSLLTGATGVVLGKFESKVYCESIQNFRVRLVFLVPPILILLTKDEMGMQYDLSSIKFVLSGAAPAGKDICEEFLAKYPQVKVLCQGYGMTECGMASHLPDFRFKPTYLGVGSIAGNFQHKVIDVLTGAELPHGQAGEICVRSPTIMSGYLNRPDETANTIDKDKWLHTGDIGYVDKEGRTFIVDRLKELIKVKGLQVPPAELEDILLSHPLVKDSAVIGIPDKNRGELVRAYVVRTNPSLTEDDVIQYIAHKVSHYKRITGGVVFIDEVPKSAAGKILRKELRARASKETRSKI